MNINAGDSLLRSIETTTTTDGNGINYGATIDLKAAALSLEGRIKCRFWVSEAFAAAANTATLLVCSGAATAPTAVVERSEAKAHSAMGIGAYLEVILPTHALDRYVRLAISNSALSATGAGMGDIIPIAS